MRRLGRRRKLTEVEAEEWPREEGKRRRRRGGERWCWQSLLFLLLLFSLLRLLLSFSSSAAASTSSRFLLLLSRESRESDSLRPSSSCSFSLLLLLLRGFRLSSASSSCASSPPRFHRACRCFLESERDSAGAAAAGSCGREGEKKASRARTLPLSSPPEYCLLLLPLPSSLLPAPRWRGSRRSSWCLLS